MTSYVKKLVEQDLANAQDNMYRARLAAGRCDPAAQYGESGKTLNQIIAGYQDWIDEAKLNLPPSEGR